MNGRAGTERRLVIATRNAHKVQEIRAILGASFQCAGLDAFPGAPQVAEDALTFAGNALKKAVALSGWLAERTGEGAEWEVLADDSGLEVDALEGAPGVHSARFAALAGETAGNAPDAANNARLLRLLAGVPWERRTARFRCVLALTPVIGGPRCNSPACLADTPEVQTTFFEGACEGRIGLEARGVGGFGYDPLFVPLGQEQSFAELGEAVKNRISHRARALEQLRAHLVG